MYRKQSTKLSKELYQHSKYTVSNLLALKCSRSLQSCTISTSTATATHCKSFYHTNGYHQRHRLSCHCYLCSKSHFHSSPHLHEQEQLQQEVPATEEQTSTPTHSPTETEDARQNVVHQTEETRSSKIESIVQEIATLNLLEVAQLVSALKAKLNLPDTAMMGAPMMAAPAAGGGAPAAGGAGEEEAEPEITQTIFDIVLKAYPQEKKVSIIKEVRAIYKLGLKEAKALVEKAPCTLQAQAPKVEADDVKAKLEAIGAEIALD